MRVKEARSFILYILRTAHRVCISLNGFVLRIGCSSRALYGVCIIQGVINPAHQQSIAQALNALEKALKRLTDAIAHSETWVSVDGTTNERQARRRLCEAYATIDYAMDDAVNASPVCLGAIAATAPILRRAQAVNDAKAAFKRLSVPLQRVRQRVPVKGADGPTKAIPVIRVILRSLQRSDLNLLAAYRKIPTLSAPPESITYTRARTRAVYRKSVDDVAELLATLEGPTAQADRARLRTLPRNERFLGLAREHYENIRANVVYARLDPKGRGRVQLAAELPLMYPQGRSAPPTMHYLGPTDADDLPTRQRATKLDPEPYLNSLPIYRYRRPERR